MFIPFDLVILLVQVQRNNQKYGQIFLWGYSIQVFHVFYIIVTYRAICMHIYFIYIPKYPTTQDCLSMTKPVK